MKNNFRLILRCCIIFLLQVLSFIFKPLVFVQLIYLLILIIIDKTENKICYLFFMLPFYNVFRYGLDVIQYNNIFSNFKSVYLSIFLVLCFCCVMFVKYIIDLKSKNKALNIKTLIIWFMFYLGFLIPIKAFNTSSLASFFVITSLFASLYLIFQYKEKFNLKKILNIWLLGIILSIILYFMKNLLPNLNEYLIEFGNRKFFIQRDPNYWGLELLTLLCGYTILLIKKNEKLSYAIVLIIVSILGFITYSKSFYISYIAYVIMMIIILFRYIFTRVQNKKLKILYLSMAFVIIVGIVIILIKNYNNIINFISGQRDYFLFDSDTPGAVDKINAITTGRFDIWIQYSKKIFLSPITFFFGRGVLSGYESVAIHNTLIQMLYFCGVPTFVSLIVVLVCVAIKNKKKLSFENIFLFLPIFVFSCSLDLLFSYRTYLILTIFLLSILCIDKVEKNSIKESIKIDFNNDLYKDKKIVLSIIIPVYNVEKYLEKCVKSICEHDLFNTEVLLIDDGSTDKSGDIAEEIAKKYDIVSVYHKTNGGLSDARNYGIKLAKGKYLCFIDSDDYVEENFKAIYNFLNKDVDIIFIGMIVESLKRCKKIKYKNEKLIIGNDEIVKKCLEIRTNKNSACMKIIKREFLIKNNLFFNNGFSEDFNWTGRVMCYATTAISTKLAYYHYIAEREGSIMNTFKKSKFYDVINHANSIMNELKKTSLSKISKKRVRQFIGFNILSIFRNIKRFNQEDMDEIIKLLKDNYELVRCQKSIFMNIFLLFAKIFGFKVAYKLLP